MKKIAKIMILLLVPVVICLINFLPKEYGVFTHPVKRYFSMFAFLFSFTLVPYLASRRYLFEMRSFIKSFLIILVVFLFFIAILGMIFDNYMGGPPRESFVILVPIFLLMVAKKYRYAHYFFFFLILYEIVASLGRAIVGYAFPLNFGFSVLIPTYTFYVTYFLSEQLLKITHKISFVFALSYSLIVLGIFMFDVSYLYVRKSDFIYLIKEYGSYDMLFTIATIITSIGIFLFFYGVYLLYRVEFERYFR